jgi:TolB-like protein/Tfp pilus assembly protein PilF
MKPKPWTRVEELYHAALERAPGEREAFLEGACGGDEELLREVKSLLGYEGEAKRFLEERVTEVATRAVSAARSPSLLGRRIQSYEILSLLGAGGMGEVYLARDTRLDRQVALKVLPAEVSDDPARLRRLQREAKALAALDHPGIVTIFSVEEAEGVHFLTMAYVKGQTLGELIPANGMPPEKLLELGAALADALRAAHEHGIVHRDLKPANVIVDLEGRLRVLDFGLARVVETVPLSSHVQSQTTEEAVTRHGMVLGTIPYMSPEQAEGKPAGPSSDLFSLGVVLYEMATGSRPFRGESAASLVSSILRDTPPPVTEVRPELPEGLGRVIQRCLEKAPGARYESAGAVRKELEALRQEVRSGRVTRAARVGWPRSRVGLVALAAVVVVLAALGGTLVWRGGQQPGRQAVEGTSAPPIRSIAVLPLRNLSGDPGQEYFADGMTEALITDLAKIGALKVISRSSVMRYKGTALRLAEIARELKVDAVVEGSALRLGDSVRVMAQLVDPKTEQALWAESYERGLEGVLQMQREVARAIAGEVQVALTPEEAKRLAGARPVNPEAYDAYLKGSYHWKKLTPQDLDTAQRYFELALAKDPSYAPAYEGLAWVWGCRQQMGIALPREAGPNAKAAALRAIALDDSSAGVHEALAAVRTWTDWDWKGAEPEWRRALELDPNSANAHAYFAHFLAITGRFDEAVPHSERALELDPFNALFHALYAQVLYGNRRYDDAVAAARAVLAMQPDHPVARNVLQMCLFSNGMLDEQLAFDRERLARDAEFVAALERGFAEGGYAGAQRRVADLLAARLEKSGRLVAPGGGGVMGIAQRHLWAGDYDQAIRWLERAHDVHSANLPYVSFQPLWDPLRSDPRFQDLLRRMNLPASSGKSGPTPLD